MSKVFDKDRVSKISQIMPQFSKVAETGDRVMMGLEGDPLFPFKTNRPEGTIVNVNRSDPSNAVVDIKFDNGQVNSYNTSTINQREVWEFTDSAFKRVMNRERIKQARAENGIQAKMNSNTNNIENQVRHLTSVVNAQHKENMAFRDTIIASLNEFATDMKKVDTQRVAGFSRVFSDEYGSMMKNRAESSLGRSASPTNFVDSGSDSSAMSDSDFF